MLNENLSFSERTTIVTHSGRFHADDVCAVAILKLIRPGLWTYRTRDAEDIEKLAPRTITLDVGGIYDPEAFRFDHHMRDAAKREDGTTYSSFGLIWKHFGMQALRKRGVAEEHLERVHAAFDHDVVLPIDKIDNGHLAPADIGETAGVSISALIDSMNIAFDDDTPRAEHDAFDGAEKLMRKFLGGRIDSLSAEARAEQILDREIISQWGEPILELPYSLDFQTALDAHGARHVLFVVQPGGSGGFSLVCAREHAGTYTNLMDLPESWAGLTGADLAEETGVADATFCHTGRFFAAIDSREGALELARLALPSDPAFEP